MKKLLLFFALLLSNSISTIHASQDKKRMNIDNNYFATAYFINSEKEDTEKEKVSPIIERKTSSIILTSEELLKKNDENDHQIDEIKKNNTNATSSSNISYQENNIIQENGNDIIIDTKEKNNDVLGQKKDNHDEKKISNDIKGDNNQNNDQPINGKDDISDDISSEIVDQVGFEDNDNQAQKNLINNNHICDQSEKNDYPDGNLLFEDSSDDSSELNDENQNLNEEKDSGTYEEKSLKLTFFINAIKMLTTDDRFEKSNKDNKKKLCTILENLVLSLHQNNFDTTEKLISETFDTFDKNHINNKHDRAKKDLNFVNSSKHYWYSPYIRYGDRAPIFITTGTIIVVTYYYHKAIAKALRKVKNRFSNFLSAL